MDDYDIERELYFAMEDETDGLGVPELDLGRMRRSGRRRTALVTGGAAAVLVVGAGAAFAVGYHSGKSAGKTAAAASPVAAVTAAPTPPKGECMVEFRGQDATDPSGPPPPIQYVQVTPTTSAGKLVYIYPTSPSFPPRPTAPVTGGPRTPFRVMYMAPCSAVRPGGGPDPNILNPDTVRTLNPSSGAPDPSITLTPSRGAPKPSGTPSAPGGS